MLPLVINEQKIFTFKFWFDGSIQDGMYCQKELFCRLQTFEARYRAQVYQLGVKISQHQDTLVAIALSSETCSLWVSLRSPLVKDALINGVPIMLGTLGGISEGDKTPLDE